MSYGLPYQGSKNKIAKWVVDNLPSADVFVDIFAGGCAVTHCAMLSGKYKRFIANDITDTVEVFKAATKGEFSGYCTVPTREEFYAEKEDDKALAILNSFGNNCKNYAYSEQKENVKVWAMRMVALPSMWERRRAYMKFIAALKEYVKNNEIPDKVQLQSLESLERPERLQSLERLERLQRLESLQSLESLESLQSLETSKLDYRCVQIPDNSIVYADPPYRGTDCKGYSGFDFDAFDKWLSIIPFPVIVSEYTSPDGCVEIASIEKTCTMQGGTHNQKKIERLFIQERFVDEYERRMKEKDQETLFERG